MTDTMMIRDCIRSQGMKLGHVGLNSMTMNWSAFWEQAVEEKRLCLM